MKDIKLSTSSHDLLIVNYDLVLVDGVDQVLQSIKMRLLFFAEEWFLDTSRGMPYFDTIGTKNPDMAIVDSIFKSTIVETIGVTNLVEYLSDFNKTERKLTISFKVETIYGASSTITIGVI